MFLSNKNFNENEPIYIQIENYIKGIDLDNNNIHLEKDYLISSGTPTTQNTWMDAKYGDFAATPRNGKVIRCQ